MEPLNRYLKENYHGQWEKAEQIVRDSLLFMLEKVDEEREIAQYVQPEWPPLWLAHWRWEFVRRSPMYQQWAHELRDLIRCENELQTLKYRTGKTKQPPKVRVAPGCLEEAGSIYLKEFCYVWGLQAVILQGEEIFLNYEFDFEEVLKCMIAMALGSPEINDPYQVLTIFAKANVGGRRERVYAGAYVGYEESRRPHRISKYELVYEPKTYVYEFIIPSKMRESIGMELYHLKTVEVKFSIIKDCPGLWKLTVRTPYEEDCDKACEVIDRYMGVEEQAVWGHWYMREQALWRRLDALDRVHGRPKGWISHKDNKRVLHERYINELTGVFEYYKNRDKRRALDIIEKIENIAKERKAALSDFPSR